MEFKVNSSVRISVRLVLDIENVVLIFRGSGLTADCTLIVELVL
jgi:hypothetical protein